MSTSMTRFLVACLFITGGIPAWWLSSALDDDTWMSITGLILLFLIMAVFALSLERRRAGKAPEVTSGVAISNDGRPGHEAGEVCHKALTIGGIVLMGFVFSWFVYGPVSGRLPLPVLKNPVSHEFSLPEPR